MFDEFNVFEEDKSIIEDVLKIGNPKYADLPVYNGNEEYQDIKALNWSKLNRFASNPEYFKRNPDWKIESASFDLGTYIHRMFLEYDKYESVYKKFEAPINPKTGASYKSGIAYDKALQEFNDSGFIAIDDKMESVWNELQDSIQGYEEYLTSTYKEVELVGEISGLKCKGKVDVYDEKLGIIDVKTVSSKLYSLNGSSNFYWKCEEYGWFYELTFYGLLVESATGLFPTLNMLAMQTTAPYQICVYEISEKVVNRCKDDILNNFIPCWKDYKNNKEFAGKRIVTL